jgi:hypothetical protein
MFKANPSKSMADHISSMAKGKSSKKAMFGKKSKGKVKGKFNLFKKAEGDGHAAGSDNDEV